MHKDWCGNPCSECANPCELDRTIFCSPDCEYLGADGEHTHLECQECDALPLQKVSIHGYGAVYVRAGSFEEAKELVCGTKEQIIKFVDENVDGCGTDIVIIAKVKGKVLTEDIIDKIKGAIGGYKSSNAGEWDTEGCIDVATEVLESEGYGVDFVNADAVICF